MPLLAELLGPAGAISAVDLAPENVARVKALGAAGRLACSLDARVGDVTALPYDDNCFDAVWSASVTQYLPEAELLAMLAETSRVLKPGGLLAIKDTEDSALCLHPIPPLLLWRLFDALAQRGEMTVAGGLRGLHLSTFVRTAGFAHVRRSLAYVERQAPLRPAEAALVAELVGWLAQEAETLQLPAADLAQWRAFGNPGDPAYSLNSPDLYWREADILVTAYRS